MTAISNEQGASIVFDLIKAIQDNKQYLSDIDGAIGDGDHGINMSKGFTICEERLANHPVNLAHGMKTLGGVLISQIGGCMGPLYGRFFQSMAKSITHESDIDRNAFGRMLRAGRDGVTEISEARLNDKTLMDVLIPAVDAYWSALDAGETYHGCLDAMAKAAEAGRDATKDMVARMGRSSRLGERSRGVIDAGAASCCLILVTMAHSMQAKLVSRDNAPRN